MTRDRSLPTGLHFQLQHIDLHSGARLGELHTLRGPVCTPAFMPVGTQATVKGLTPEMVRSTGAQMVLANTYHLALRPGEDVIKLLGGLHQFSGWTGPILTDSGGFQLFSLARISAVTDAGAQFRSHIDGRLLELSPERAVEIQEQLGSDIAMVLDHVVALPSDRTLVEEACQRTVLWAERSQAAAVRKDQSLFAIVQGGLDPQLRQSCAERLVALDFPGYAIGGLSVGEAPAEMYRILDVTAPLLPEDRPGYLMGVGRPEDLLEAIRRGVDLFDCVMPTRNGRNALAFTDRGTLRMKNRVHREDARPLEEECPCAACQHSRGFLRHLFIAGEMLGPILLSIHNLTYYQRLLSTVREAIKADRFEECYREKIAGWQTA